MPGKSQMENVVEKLRAELGLYVQLIEGTDCAAATIDAMGMSAAAWAVLGQSPAARSAVDVLRSADELHARLAVLRESNEKAAIGFHHFGKLAAKEFRDMVLGRNWPRRSKPARRAMAKLAARRGRRG